MVQKIKLLIVDDRDIIRDGLKLFFSNDKVIKVKDEASDGFEAMQLIKKNDYDVVLMDINMPKMNGIEATKLIKKIKSDVRILVNSFYVNPFLIKEIAEAGASGFIKKGENKKQYVEAIQSVNDGKIYLSDEVHYKIYDKVLTFLKGSS